MHALALALTRHAARVAAAVALVAGLTAAVQLAPATADDETPIPRDPVTMETRVTKGRMLFVPSIPCKREDGPGPCFWDAGRRGNGHGFSYVVTRRGRIVYLDDRRND